MAFRRAAQRDPAGLFLVTHAELLHEVAGLDAGRHKARCAAGQAPGRIAGHGPRMARGSRRRCVARRLVRYLKRFDSGAPVDALMTAPDIDGQIFYNDTMSGFNFHRNRLPLSAIAEQVLRYAQFAKSPAVAAQSALIRDCLPGFDRRESLRIGR